MKRFEINNERASIKHTAAVQVLVVRPASLEMFGKGQPSESGTRAAETEVR